MGFAVSTVRIVHTDGGLAMAVRPGMLPVGARGVAVELQGRPFNVIARIMRRRHGPAGAAMSLHGWLDAVRAGCGPAPTRSASRRSARLAFQSIHPAGGGSSSSCRPPDRRVACCFRLRVAPDDAAKKAMDSHTTDRQGSAMISGDRDSDIVRATRRLVNICRRRRRGRRSLATRRRRD